MSPAARPLSLAGLRRAAYRLANEDADLKGLPAPPGAAELEAVAEQWRPWRSVAARILWSHYLEPEPRPPLARRPRP